MKATLKVYDESAVIRGIQFLMEIDNDDRDCDPAQISVVCVVDPENGSVQSASRVA